AAVELLAAGWRVLANGKPFRPATAFAARVRSGQSWFEVEGNIEFDGERLALPELLRAARRGQRLVELGDGSFGLLPEAWLTRLGVLGADDAGAGKVRVPRSQLLFLDELASAEAGVSVDAAFQRLREELRAFAELSPAEPPPTFRGELRDYQRQGLAWMQLLGRSGFGGCLADDMGLGKTVQVLALLLGRKRRRRSLPSLVVAPSSVVFNWAEEARRFAPSLRAVIHAGPTRAPLEEALQRADVIVTSYALLRREAPAFTAAEFDCVILDEAQAIKNHETETAKVARALRASARLTMTGTPIENHLGELASQLEFLNPGLLGSSPRLAKALLSGHADAETLQLVQRAVKPFLLRRTKREVARELPERVEQDVFVELGKRERRRYDELLRHYRRRIEDQVAKVGLTRSTPQVLEALLRLRQAACHPGLIDPARRVEPSAKLDRVIEEIERIGELGERCLVFSQFTSLLAILRDRLDARGVRYEYLDGRTRHRQAAVERFQSSEGAPVFLISLLAGGVGLNLTAAEHVLLLDPWWNPAVEAQAIDRSHRIGQTRTVFAYKLIARGTVEEKVIALQKEKRALAEAILGDGAGLGGKLTREDLEVLLG
ncbi:MAG: DEAD/DEAH box helicase family protein, partial [Myxococcales bacterium]|nr:DEAD/DEAH box helicase family protein [Myxococcales bacterium]